MKKKVLVIGIKGMAGHVLFRKLRRDTPHEIFGLARNIDAGEHVFNLDVSETEKLKKLFSEQNFDVIINAVGILNKDAEDHPDKAIWFNSYFPHFLEAATRGTRTKVIHISTDCVFDGAKGGYTEKDFRNGKGFYAQSKALGELENGKDLTLRTSIIGPELNPEGIGLFHWFMKVPHGQEIGGYTRAFWSGITTVELAKVIAYILDNDIAGLLQVAPAEKIDKYSLLKLFNRIFRENAITITENSTYAVDKSLISLRKDFAYKVPSYEQMLTEMKEWIGAENSYSYG